LAALGYPADLMAAFIAFARTNSVINEKHYALAPSKRASARRCFERLAAGPMNANRG